MSYIYDLSDAWNSAPTTYTAIKMNVTDTASAAGSLLMDLQVGGSSRFQVSAKTSEAYIGRFSSGGGERVRLSAQASGSSLELFAGASNTFIGMGTIGSTDLQLYRDAANTLAQRNGTSAQTFRIYNTYTDASNYSRGFMRWTAGNFEIGAEGAGTGPISSHIRLIAASQNWLSLGASGTTGGGIWQINSAGHFLAGTDNTYDIGAAGANRPRNVYAGTTVRAPEMLTDNIKTASGSGGLQFTSTTLALLTQTTFQLGGTTNAFPALKRNGAVLQVRLADDSADAPFTSGRAIINGLTVGLGGQTAVATNTALGVSALNSASLTGGNNTAIGTQALEVNTTGADNTAVGLYALLNNTTASSNAAFGRNALAYFNTSNNTALGFEAGRGSTTVANNTGAFFVAIGYRALRNVTSGNSNVAVGQEALEVTTTGSNNVGVGLRALQLNTTGSNNTGIGDNALVSNSSASANTAVGRAAAYYFNTGNNTAVGFEALRGSTTVANNTGSNLTAVGYQALLSNTTGASNSAVSYLALYSNTTGNNSSAMGASALQNNTTGGSNSAMGYAALYSNTTGGDNSAVGSNALFSNTTGSNNTGIGEQAGDVITTGARNTIVGANSDPSANNGNDQTVIGEGLTGKGDDTFFCGGTNGAYNEKNVTTWETTSDARIKKNIVSNTSGLDIINQIQVRNFEYRTPEEITDLPQSAAINQPGVQLGVIAQELQAVLPECVTENSTGVLSVSTDPLVWYLINAVKQLSAEVKALKGE